MSIPVADQFADIAKRIREIELEDKGEQPKPAETPQISPSEQESNQDWGCWG